MRQHKLVSIPTIRDSEGTLGVIERSDQIPFDVQRVYFVYDTTAGAQRGNHAHRELQQLLVAVTGSCDVRIKDGLGEETVYTLDHPTEALLLPKGYWRSLENFAGGTTLVVAASALFDESDYIRDWEEFVAWKANQESTSTPQDG